MEDEIKIEYEESTEIDPLSGETPSSETGVNMPRDAPSPISRVEADILNSPAPKIIPHLEINEAADVKTLESKVLVEENKEEETPAENKGSALNSALDSNQEDSVTWYRAIDSSGKLICNFCDRTYAVLTSLRYHVNMKHPAEVVSLKNNILKKRRSSQPLCHLCRKRFSCLTKLKNHIQEHKIENVANSCPHCNAAFSETQEMIYHLKTNHNVLQNKLHICNTCGYRTHKMSHLKQHIYTHSTEKRNKCEYCDYATNHKSNLRNHERIHTSNKSFTCNFDGCKSSFTDMTGLNYHIQKHYPDKNMLYCDQCSYKTVYKQSLKVHVESHLRR